MRTKSGMASLIGLLVAIVVVAICLMLPGTDNVQFVTVSQRFVELYDMPILESKIDESDAISNSYYGALAGSDAAGIVVFDVHESNNVVVYLSSYGEYRALRMQDGYLWYGDDAIFSVVNHTSGVLEICPVYTSDGQIYVSGETEAFVVEYNSILG